MTNLPPFESLNDGDEITISGGLVTEAHDGSGVIVVEFFTPDGEYVGHTTLSKSEYQQCAVSVTRKAVAS